MRLRSSSSSEWLHAVISDFDGFLPDHAACERKASGTAMAFVAHYPDVPEIVGACTELAVEELGHFRDVVGILLRRGLTLRADARDPYVRGLAREFRGGSREYLLDRLLVAAIVEARGCERLARIAAAVPEPDLRDFYRDLARSEARHQDLYADIARRLFSSEEVAARSEELLDAEDRILETLPPGPALFHAAPVRARPIAADR